MINGWTLGFGIPMLYCIGAGLTARLTSKRWIGRRGWYGSSNDAGVGVLFFSLFWIVTWFIMLGFWIGRPIDPPQEEQTKGKIQTTIVSGELKELDQELKDNIARGIPELDEESGLYSWRYPE